MTSGIRDILKTMSVKGLVLGHLTSPYRVTLFRRKEWMGMGTILLFRRRHTDTTQDPGNIQEETRNQKEQVFKMKNRVITFYEIPDYFHSKEEVLIYISVPGVTDVL